MNKFGDSEDNQQNPSASKPIEQQLYDEDWTDLFFTFKTRSINKSEPVEDSSKKYEDPLPNKTPDLQESLMSTYVFPKNDENLFGLSKSNAHITINNELREEDQNDLNDRCFSEFSPTFFDSKNNLLKQSSSNPYKNNELIAASTSCPSANAASQECTNSDIKKAENQTRSSPGITYPFIIPPSSHLDSILIRPHSLSISAPNNFVPPSDTYVLKHNQNEGSTVEIGTSQDLDQFCHFISCLFHSYICKIDSNVCNFTSCNIYKNISLHIGTCRLENCGVDRCKKVRTFFRHFSTCSKINCNVCTGTIQLLKEIYISTSQFHTLLGCVPLKQATPDTIFGNFYSVFLKINPPTSTINHSSTIYTTPQIESFTKNMNGLETQYIKSPNIVHVKTSDNDEINSNSVIVEETFDSKYLYDTFFPILNKLLRTADSVYFNQPVDPIKLCIPDYPEIIREPMDFSTIADKLSNYKYKSIWDVIYDINLVFDNAYLYNKKNTRVHKGAVKLSAVFEAFSFNFMKSHLYCCNKRFVYSLQVLYCNSKDFCVIPCNGNYYRLDDKIHFCVNCFNNCKEENISCNREGFNDPLQVSKSSFMYVRNNETIYEPFVICAICRKKYHRGCVMHVDVIDGCFYYCDKCFDTLKLPRRYNAFISKNLPRTHLSDYIEDRVNKAMRSEIKDCQYINIRLICNIDKVIETRPSLVRRFNGAMSSSFPYKSKAVFAFQEHEAKEVCFFSMHVQEYGEECAEPNRRRVYLSYLDSVHYFQPRHLRTQLYHEIVLSYLSYCKLMGFLYCHIWSCPPCEGDDYVFHCHSIEQKLPKPRRLLEWYNKFIEVGMERGVIIEYKDIYKYFQGFRGELAPSIPYFDGDYWSNSLEDIITEYEKEFHNSSENILTKNIKNGPKHKIKRNKVGKIKNSAPKRSNAEEITLNQKIFSLMEKYKEVFFVLKLNIDSVPFTLDPNPALTSDLMDGRSGFLTMCRDNHWEFSSRRQAYYSTKAMLFVVHQQMFNFIEFTCDRCRAVLCKGYNCESCKDYDLCYICHIRFGHKHTMNEKTFITFDLSASVTTGSSKIPLLPSEKNVNISQNTRNSIESFLSGVRHAVTCYSNECAVENCYKVKLFMHHFQRCNIANKNSCPTCRQMYIIYNYHATNCTDENCVMPFCSRLKVMIIHSRAHADMKTRSRIANMNCKLNPPISTVLKNEPLNLATTPSHNKSYDTDGSLTNISIIKTPITTNSVVDSIFAHPQTETISHNSRRSELARTPGPGLKKEQAINTQTPIQTNVRPSSRAVRPPNALNDLFQTRTESQQGINAVFPNSYSNIPQTVVNQNVGDNAYHQRIILNANMQQEFNRRSVEQQIIASSFNQTNISMDSLSHSHAPNLVCHTPVMGNINQGTNAGSFITPPNYIYRTISPQEIKLQNQMAPQGINHQMAVMPMGTRMVSPRNQRLFLPQQYENIRLQTMNIHPNSNPTVSSQIDPSAIITNPQYGRSMINNRLLSNNFFLQQMPMNNEIGLIDPNSHQMYPGGGVLINNQIYSVNQLQLLAMQQQQQALLHQQQARAQNIAFKNQERSMFNVNWRNLNMGNTMMQYNNQHSGILPNQYNSQNMILTRGGMQTPNQFNQYIPSQINPCTLTPTLNMPIYSIQNATTQQQLSLHNINTFKGSR